MSMIARKNGGGGEGTAKQLTELAIHRQQLGHLCRLFASDAVQRESHLPVPTDPLLDLGPRVVLAREELVVCKDVVGAERLQVRLELVDGWPAVRSQVSVPTISTLRRNDFFVVDGTIEGSGLTDS